MEDAVEYKKKANRVGNLTSSEIVALMSNDKSGKSPGKPFWTYIEECNMERRLGRSLETETNSRPTSWGNLCEMYVMSKNELIGTEYSQRPNEPIVNLHFDFHCGTPDMTKNNTVCDLKCPYTLKSFCQLVQPIYKGLEGFEAMQWIRDNYVSGTKKMGDTYYWQLVSNAILTDSKYAELHIFCPFRNELNEIRDLAHQQNGNDLKKYYWIAMSEDEDLPYLKVGGYYKNINKIRFEVPADDKEALIERIKQAEFHLLKWAA